MTFWRKWRAGRGAPDAEASSETIVNVNDGGGGEGGERLPSPAGDHAVRSRAEDRLGRTPLADAIAAQIAGTRPDAGVVFGVVGPWGSGKTSLLGMIKEALREDHGSVAFYFNPWLFSGTDHLSAIFFAELGAQMSEMGELWQELGATMQSVGAVLTDMRTLPLFIGRVAAAGGRTLERSGRRMQGTADEDASLYERRRRLEEALEKVGRRTGKRIVIMVDDLDRLRQEEIRDVVALVRLNADLPNLVFVLAYDRARALSRPWAKRRGTAALTWRRSCRWRTTYPRLGWWT